ncbi:mitogen-activated protein kinase organizer 1 [Saccharata proteae CBS 121410]|uniref:Mitogen-activated protein kinase organizer 1 n=1 Tax=Saccharata proteae CBS 121410 TaxID=1314787 RepID=A0A9P4LZ70_9PEZI|nr:mitogen-activated protein kinase organizer 1 [Saccharata proteae CBS 121410]
MTAQFPTRKIATLTGHNANTYAHLTYITIRKPPEPIAPHASTISTSSGLVQTYSAHGYEVLDISVTDDNARFVSGGGDKTVFVWDVPTARTQRRFAGHAGRVNAVAWGAGGDVVISGSYDGTVKLWDTKSQSWKAMMTMSEAKDSVSSVCVLDHEIIAGSIDGRVRTYDLRMGMVYVDVIGHPVTSLTATKQGDSLLVSSLDSSLRLMDRPNGKLLQSFKAAQYTNADYRIRSTLGLNDSVVVSGSEDGSILVWDLLEGEVLHRLRHGEARDGAMGRTKKDVVSAVTFSKARKEWASAGGDGNVVIWGVDDY